jgi:hypothetical protein
MSYVLCKKNVIMDGTNEVACYEGGKYKIINPKATCIAILNEKQSYHEIGEKSDPWYLEHFEIVEA